MITAGPPVGTEIALRQVAELLTESGQLSQRISRVIVKENEHLLFESLFGEVAATCTVEWPFFPSRNIAKIKHLVVRKKLRKLGLGRKITSKALDICKKAVIIYTVIRTDNLPSLKTFRSLGFEEVMIVEGHNGLLRILVDIGKITRLENGGKPE